MTCSESIRALIKVLKANEVIVNSKDFGLTIIEFIEKYEDFLMDAVVAVGKFKKSDLCKAVQETCLDVNREEAVRFSMISCQCVVYLQIRGCLCISICLCKDKYIYIYIYLFKKDSMRERCSTAGMQ